MIANSLARLQPNTEQERSCARSLAPSIFRPSLNSLTKQRRVTHETVPKQSVIQYDRFETGPHVSVCVCVCECRTELRSETSDTPAEALHSVDDCRRMRIWRSKFGPNRTSLFLSPRPETRQDVKQQPLSTNLQEPHDSRTNPTTTKPQNLQHVKRQPLSTKHHKPQDSRTNKQQLQKQIYLNKYSFLEGRHPGCAGAVCKSLGCVPSFLCLAAALWACSKSRAGLERVLFQQVALKMEGLVETFCNAPKIARFGARDAGGQFSGTDVLGICMHDILTTHRVHVNALSDLYLAVDCGLSLRVWPPSSGKRGCIGGYGDLLDFLFPNCSNRCQHASQSG